MNNWAPPSRHFRKRTLKLTFHPLRLTLATAHTLTLSPPSFATETLRTSNQHQAAMTAFFRA
jgi:hypothetical protein